jgi:hypothetical protein
MLIWHKQPTPMGTLAVAQWARINDVRLSRFSLVSDHAVYHLSLIGHLAPSLGHLDVGCAQRITPRCRHRSHSWPFGYNVQLDRSCFLIAPVEHTTAGQARAKSHHAIWIRSVCREGLHFYRRPY